MLKIGSLVLSNPVLLAPMEDVTNQSFRRICKRIANPGLMFTEFVSAMAIHHQAEKTFRKMIIHPDERPVGIQIFGSDPAIMAQTAKIAVDQMGADIVDINMGCWVPKVCKTGSGAALLKDPDLAEAIVRAVVEAVQVPVTVKVRAGWDYSLFAAPELAKRFENVGAKMITLHARFAKQGFKGEAHWDLIRQMRSQIKIPLIGNGDIKTPEDAKRMMSETGCDGVMIGRAAVSNPWALRAIVEDMMNLILSPLPILSERIEVALEHTQNTIAFFMEKDTFEEALRIDPKVYQEKEVFAIRSLRGQLPLYLKGFEGASEIRSKLNTCNTYKELEDLLLKLV